MKVGGFTFLVSISASMMASLGSQFPEAHSPFVIRIGPGAEYYDEFWLQTLGPLLRNLRHGADIPIHLVPESVDNCDDPTDLVIRGWASKPNPCRDRTEIFISSEPWDATSINSRLLIDCKLSQTLRPPSTVSALLFLPFYSLSFAQRMQYSPLDLVHPMPFLSIETPPPLEPRSKFCAFVARNCMRERTDMVALLSSYRPVDALGSCGAKARVAHEDVAGFETINEETYLDRLVNVYKQYRFVICFESARIQGDLLLPQHSMHSPPSLFTAMFANSLLCVQCVA